VAKTSVPLVQDHNPPDDMPVMHLCTTPVGRKQLLDPGACGVRLGVELRAAAEREAYAEGMVLSHWIRKVVQEAVHRRRGQKECMQESNPIEIPVSESNITVTELDRNFQKEMEKLNDR
jgi:hypothetical protein